MSIQTGNGTQHTDVARRSGGLRVSAVVVGIIGGISGLLGGVILLGGDDQHIGLGGDLSWRVGDIAAGWGYALLALAAGCLIAAIGLATRRRHAGSPRDDARADLVVHAVVYLAVNAFLWVQDIALGGGLDYAYWITIPWGVGLLGHTIAVLRRPT